MIKVIICGTTWLVPDRLWVDPFRSAVVKLNKCHHGERLGWTPREQEAFTVMLSHEEVFILDKF